MSNYIEPPSKPDVSAMKNLVTSTAKNVGQSLVIAVENACESAYNTAVDTVSSMVDSVVNSVGGIIDTGISTVSDIKSNVESLGNNLINKIDNFESNLDEALDDITANVDADTVGEYLGIMYDNAANIADNLTPKQLKNMIDDPAEIISKSSELVKQGQDKLKELILK